MSGLFGGSSGKGSPQDVYIPPFLSSGGVTPQQQTLADFSYGQDLTGENTLFGGSGTGMSTMATQGAEGAANTKAQALGGMSDTNQGAMYTDYTNTVGAEEQGLQNQIATQGDTGTSLASLAGTALGSGTNTNLQTQPS